MSKEESTRLNTEVPLALYKDFKRACLDADLTVSAAIRNLMAEWVERQRKVKK